MCDVEGVQRIVWIFELEIATPQVDTKIQRFQFRSRPLYAKIKINSSKISVEEDISKIFVLRER